MKTRGGLFRYFAHGVGENKTLKDLAWFCEVRALFHAFFSVRSIKNRMHEKTMFELNEKVLWSSVKINFGVRIARVLELKRIYRTLCLH